MDYTVTESGASSSIPTPPVSPSIGNPSDGIPETGVIATVLGAYWFYQIAKEIQNVIIEASIIPSASTLNQLLSALQILFAPLANAITNVQVFGSTAASASFTPTKSRILISGVGGGGGGGGGLSGGTPMSGYAGGGGSAAAGILSGQLSCIPGAALTISIGVGGTGGAIGSAGANGSATTISGLPSQPGVIDGVFSINGGSGGNPGNSSAGYALGGALSSGSTSLTDLGSPGGIAYGYQPGAGGGTCLSPGAFPIIGSYPPTNTGNNGNSRGSGGAGGAPGYAGQNGGSGILIIEQ